MSRTVVVRKPSIATAHTGKGIMLPVGRYEVAALDGTAERGEVYVTGPDRTLVRINQRDPNITIKEG